MDHCAPETGRMILACSEELKFVVLVRLYDGIAFTCENVCNMVCLESLRECLYEFDDHSHLLTTVKLLFRMQTVVACPAVFHLIILSEIAQKEFASAWVGLSICDSLHQKLLSDLLLGNRFALHELLKLLDVFVAVECYALTLFAVTTGTSCLLIVSFNTLRNVIMNYKTYVRLVNTHSERYGRHDDVHLFHKELVLILGAGLCIQSSMIRRGLDAVDVQQFSKLLHFLAA